MNKKIYRTNALAMLKLVICSLKGETPPPEFIEKLDLEQLFEVCQEHILTACVAYTLESAGIKDKKFTEAKLKAVRKNILLDAERKKILSRLEQEKIWYMPLKGAILKDWYPKIGMRQMSDNDILCDSEYRTEIKEIMLDMGFSCEHFEEGNDDAYFKPPVSNFEMHNELFNITQAKKLHKYYAGIKNKLIKDESNNYGYHFRTEDFYIYMIAHEYRHFSLGGTGLRAIADHYVFLKKWGSSLDWKYVLRELKKLGIAEYERNSRKLTVKLFKKQELTDKEKQILSYYIFSGTYGNLENKVKHIMERQGNSSKAEYIFRRLFPTMEEIKTYHVFFYRHKWLIPVMWLCRPIKILANRERIIKELKYLFST